ncbi:2,3,4,5-tetrahydropyridine-2,6-dicarboxylate N-acetyltransferase [compost metagenome]
MQPHKLIISIINKLILILESAISELRIKAENVETSKSLKVKGLIYISNQGIIKIGENVKINSSLLGNPIANGRCSFATTPTGEIIISDNVGISGTTIYSANKIYIGKNSYIGAGVKIFDTDFHSLSHIERFTKGDCNIKTGAVTISENCFIGAESIILKNISIGENSVVAAGSIVVSNIPENEVWGGVPARFLKKNI